jgi:hypothetical protein
VVVVAARSVVVVVGSSVVVVVGSRVVVVDATVVVVVSTLLTGAGWGSVVVGAAAGGGPVELGGGSVAVGRGTARETGATPGDCSGGAVVEAEVDDRSGPVLEGGTEGAGPAVAGAVVGSVGSASTTVGAGGAGGTSAAEATTAASTAKVIPNATSMSR